MFRRLACVSLLLVSFVAPCTSHAQDPAGGKQQAAPKRRTESFWHKVLRISGIADSPSTLKSAGDEVESGQIWIAEIRPRRTRKLTDSGGYCSPVFVPRGNDVLSLKGADVVRVSSAGGKPKVLYQITGITKLVGFSLDDPDRVLVLLQDVVGHSGVALLSVSDGKVTPLAYDPASSDDRHMIEHLRGWDRMYSDKSLYVRSQTKSSMAGTVEWTDIFLKAGTNAPVNVSKCNGVNCGQPSLSADGQLVVFIRAEQE